MMAQGNNVIDLHSRINNRNTHTENVAIEDNNHDFTKVEVIVPRDYDIRIDLVKKETRLDTNNGKFNDSNTGIFSPKQSFLLDELYLTHLNTNLLTRNETAVANLTSTSSNNRISKYFDNHIGKDCEYDIIKAEKEIIDQGQGNQMVDKFHQIIKEQISFLLLGIVFTIVSLIGISVFYGIGYYVVHPTLYLVTLLMGIGWSATALMSIKNNKGDSLHDK